MHGVWYATPVYGILPVYTTWGMVYRYKYVDGGNIDWQSVVKVYGIGDQLKEGRRSRWGKMY